MTNQGSPTGSGSGAGETDHRIRPSSKAFLKLMKAGWAPPTPSDATQLPSAPFAARRRAALASEFPGKRLVIPAGQFKVRSNDTDYRYRPHAAFTHLTGLGAGEHPDAALVLHPGADGSRAVLYLPADAGKDSDKFFRDSRNGEFWVGRRPTLADEAIRTGIETKPLDQLRADLIAGLGQLGEKVYGDDGLEHMDALVVPDADPAISQMVADARAAAGLSEPGASGNAKLATKVSELRLIKDEHEIAEMRAAVAATMAGFNEIVKALPAALAHPKGERLIETIFDAHARLTGNSVGYETISASGAHATILHWIDSTGPVRPGDLLLVDAGVEVDSLYTADITRTLPVSGTFTPVQRQVYQAVYDAAQAAFAAARPGAKFRDVHDAAMKVIASRLFDWGLLPKGISVKAALRTKGQQHRRWMVHGTSHHLGLDVHDCAQARTDRYTDGELEPGMVITIEPGLYFQPDDLLVPEQYRGIGVRIEDDILITADGAENLSAALPAAPDQVEAWLAELLGSHSSAAA